ncbi:putative integral membrane protein [Thermogutta terrifontis]|uniref:Putative integral membrane protein n=1 Tax=Thermogutta terrifontis TaxID=1331910 RepID=A0A286RBC5_9BACT|nr:hypothetical protein [Thermogutta terrifontis]ASV73260.1 putative integral membrane protein [Thermogutta terrifontis]
MIELKGDELVFRFPEVHEKARLRISFQRTLRIPDDNNDYPLPPGLGRFPLRHVDDFADRVPRRWLEHGGVMFPMYQSEAMWIDFESDWIKGHSAQYPFAVKVATGKINVVTGEPWTRALHNDPQDYMVIPEQPWLDGYCVEKGVIRQFVAMPLGAGYSAEEQITGEAEHGGIQIIAYPMKRKAFERYFPASREDDRCSFPTVALQEEVLCGPAMGLAPGGRMRQMIYEDPYELDDWDQEHFSRCFVHIANSLVWRSITGEAPPTVPPTAKEYTDAGLPWFDYYDETLNAVEGSSTLQGLKSVLTLGKEKKDVPLPENCPVTPEIVIRLRRGLTKDQVREGAF